MYFENIQVVHSMIQESGWTRVDKAAAQTFHYQQVFPLHWNFLPLHWNFLLLHWNFLPLHWNFSSSSLKLLTFQQDSLHYLSLSLHLGNGQFETVATNKELGKSDANIRCCNILDVYMLLLSIDCKFWPFIRVTLEGALADASWWVSYQLKLIESNGHEWNPRGFIQSTGIQFGIQAKGWIFGKVPNGLWPHPSFSESYVAIFSEIHDRSIVYNGKNLQHKFLDWKWPPPLPPLELFRKFIRFGRGMRPLIIPFFTFASSPLTIRSSSAETPHWHEASISTFKKNQLSDIRASNVTFF